MHAHLGRQKWHALQPLQFVIVEKLAVLWYRYTVVFSKTLFAKHGF